LSNPFKLNAPKLEKNSAGVLKKKDLDRFIAAGGNSDVARILKQMWCCSYSMPEPMPKKPKPKPKRKKKTSSSGVSIHKGGIKPSGYTTSIGVGGMSFDHKMT
jgi:hypothetical protein